MFSREIQVGLCLVHLTTGADVGLALDHDRQQGTNEFKLLA